MNKSCMLSGQVFEISLNEQKLYESLGLPLPNISPEHRNRRRISYRNFINLYHKKCSNSSADLISMYKPDSEYKVIQNSSWWSEDWDPKIYAQTLDLSQNIFDQYHKLDLLVPRMPTIILNSDNCDYTNLTLNSRNCYMVSGCVKSQDCIYGNIVWESSNCVDCLYVFQSQWCAHSVDLANCYETFYSQESINCSNCYFLYDCRGCTNCFACYNLKNKHYCFMNKQLSKEEYFRKVAQYLPLKNSTCSKIMSWLKIAQIKEAIHPQGFYLNSERVTGNHIYNSAELDCCFDVKRCERSAHLYTALDVSESADISFTGAKTTFSFNSLTLAESENCISSHQLRNCYDVAYSEFCYSSKHLFACNGLRNAEYCILNKQYSRDEFFRLRSKLVQVMKEQGIYGEFFPEQYSPFSYNDSVVSEYYDFNQIQAEKLGYRWEVDNTPNIEGLPAPDSSDWGQDLLNHTFICATSGSAFKYIKQELDFYKRFKLPLPMQCFKQRHKSRMKLRQPRSLSTKNCISCQKSMESAVKFERVFCDLCYLEA